MKFSGHDFKPIFEKEQPKMTFVRSLFPFI